MENSSSFKELFYSLCELLGESRTELTNHLGVSNDISENEDRAFIGYKDINASFRVKNNRVDHLTVPIADAYGHDYNGPTEFYSFDGVELGMTKEEIIAKWGEPVSRKYLNYENKVTKSGKTFTIGFGFNEDADNVLRLKSFSAYPYVKPTFEKVFIELAELLGCNEDTIVDNIGKPDSTKTNEYGTKFIFYERYKAIFTISSDLHTASYVSAPNSGIDGGALQTTDNYFTIQGIKIGDSRDVVLRKWGNPTSQAVYNWAYGNKGGNTKSRNQYEIRLGFKTSNPDNVAEFEAGIKEVEEQYVQPTSEKPKSGCFVATACYGDYNASEVVVLREFRDNVLLNSSAGSLFVKFYYFVSPPIAKIIEKSSILKTIVRNGFLAPIIRKIKQNQ